MKICERIDGSVARFAQADEDVVDDGTPRIRNIEGYKFDDRWQMTDDRWQWENFIRISEILRITEEGRPGGDRDRPKRNVCGGNEYEQNKITVLCKIPP